MSTKASITAGERHHLFFEEYSDTAPENVLVELTRPSEFSFTKETRRHAVIENLIVEIPSEVMDDSAIARIKKRKLQGAVGRPVGNELGNPDNP